MGKVMGNEGNRTSRFGLRTRYRVHRNTLPLIGRSTTYGLRQDSAQPIVPCFTFHSERCTSHHDRRSHRPVVPIINTIAVAEQRRYNSSLPFSDARYPRSIAAISTILKSGKMLSRGAMTEKLKQEGVTRITVSHEWMKTPQRIIMSRSRIVPWRWYQAVVRLCL